MLDEKFYKQKYGINDVDLFDHFVHHGIKNNFNPNPIVNISFLRDQYGIQSFSDLIQFVEDASGNPSQYFDVEFYYSKHKDVAAAGVPAVKHYLRNGRFEGRVISETHNYTYNELFEIEVSSIKNPEDYLKDLREMSEDHSNVKLKPFQDHWDNSYALQHIYMLKSNDKVDKKAYDAAFWSKKNVAIIGDLSIPQCKKYRIAQKVEYFEKIGYNCSYSHWLDVPRSLNILQTASSVIFYRVPLTKLVSSYIDESIRLGIPVGYDIDDPVFDLRIYSGNINLNFIDAAQKENILSGVEHYAAMVRQVDFIIASTPAMRALLSEYTNKDIYLWRNIMDSESLNAEYIYSQLAGENYYRSKATDKFIIGYASGSKAHEADFSMAINAIHQLLTDNSHVHIQIIGHCAMGEKLRMNFPNRVRIRPYSNYNDYIAHLASVHLNMIPLVQDQFNECKSAIRFLESGLVRVPTIVSAVGDFINLIEDGQNGFLVSRPHDWKSKLQTILDGKFDLIAMGERAHEYVIHHQSINSVGSKLSEELIQRL